MADQRARRLTFGLFVFCASIVLTGCVEEDKFKQQVQTEILELQNDAAATRNRVAAMQVDVQSVKTDVQFLDQRVESVTIRQDHTEAVVADVRSDATWAKGLSSAAVAIAALALAVILGALGVAVLIGRRVLGTIQASFWALREDQLTMLNSVHHMTLAAQRDRRLPARIVTRMSR